MNPIALGLLVLSLVQGNEITNRIVDGTASSPKPWMVALRHPQAACGGTLYAKSMVISAAHCVLHNPNDWLAHVNKFDLSKVEEHGSIHKVLKAIPHPQYSKKNNRFDVSVWWIDSTSDERTIVKLDDGTQLQDKMNKLNIMGWGHTNRKGPQGSIDPDQASDILLEAQVPLNDDRKCLRKYPTQFDPNTMICTGYDVSNSSSCQGDSGGPVFRGNGVDDLTLVGIVSFGVGCGYQDYYSVDVKVANPSVSNFINWHVDKFTAMGKGIPTPPNDVTTNPPSDGLGDLPSQPVPSLVSPSPHDPIIIRKPRETRPRPNSPTTNQDLINIINAIRENQNWRQPNQRHPAQQPNQRFPTQQPNQRYPTQQPNQWYPTQQPNQQYPIQQPNQRYPTQQPNQWYPAQQPNYPSSRHPSQSRYPRHTPSYPHFPSSSSPSSSPYHRSNFITNVPHSTRHYHYPQSKPYTPTQFTLPITP